MCLKAFFLFQKNTAYARKTVHHDRNKMSKAIDSLGTEICRIFKKKKNHTGKFFFKKHKQKTEWLPYAFNKFCKVVSHYLSILQEG